MHKIIGFIYRIVALMRAKVINHNSSAKKYADKKKKYVGKPLLNVDDANQKLIDMINSGKPFLAGRFGSTELLNMRSYEFGKIIGQKYGEDYHFSQLCEWSGFFPTDISLLSKFVEIMKEACHDIDFLAVWFQPFEDYYLKKEMRKDVQITYLLDYEPWAGKVHWSSALKGKRVLVIHPFEDTILKQYKRRKEIFPGTDILPEFKLLTIKAVQTLASTKDSRFNSWFDALDWMYSEAMKIDFDIAIIGCGAYGLPLAARIKKSGKQAIHLAGATQLLFGIKGRRWEEDPAFHYIKKQFNEFWVYPSEKDTIMLSKNVEGGCYWR